MTQILAPDARKSSEREKKSHQSHVCSAAGIVVSPLTARSTLVECEKKSPQSHVCRTPAPPASPVAAGAAGREVRTLRTKRGAAPLGTITKYPATGMGASSRATNSVAEPERFERIDPETGEIRAFEVAEKGNVVEVRSFANTRQARYSLHRAFKQIEPTHRTAQCLWCMVDPKKTVQVMLDVEQQRARYNNLRVCGSVWACPFCSAKISERRAGELSDALVVAKELGLKVALLTCTVPHVAQEALKPLLKKLQRSWRGFMDNRAGQVIQALLGVEGTIRNLETTHGENGWHPHFHCLVFYRNDVDLAEIEGRWAAHWQHVCVKAGLRRPSDAHGLTLQNGDYAAKYVSKWGLEHEMTKSMHKVARKGGRTPFDILRDYEQGLDREENAKLFREFVAAFHGARQLVWSNGLKDLLAVEEVTDEELATREDERPTRLVCELNKEQWWVVRQHYRAALLSLAEKNPAAIPAFLEDLQI